MAISIVKDAGSGYNLLRNTLESADHILVAGFRGTRHVPRFVDNFLIDRKKLIEVVDCVRIFLEEFRFSRSSFPSFHQIEDVDWCTVSFKKVIKVQSSGAIEWIDKVEFYWRFWCNASIVLCPVERYATPMLDVGGIIWVRKELRAWGVEGSCENFGNNLFSLDIICNIALFPLVDLRRAIQTTHQVICTTFQETRSSKISRPPRYYCDVYSASIDRKSCDLLVKSSTPEV
jgi:hypothetical protein